MLGLTVCLSSYLSFRRNSDKTIDVINSRDESYDVFTNFVDRNQTEALYTLIVNTSKSIPDTEQAYMAGYAEGYTTADLIEMHYTNVLNDLQQN